MGSSLSENDTGKYCVIFSCLVCHGSVHCESISTPTAFLPKFRQTSSKEVLDRHALTSSTLAKWRRELKDKDKSAIPVNRNRKASKASKRKIAPKLSLDDILKELNDLEKELNQIEQRRQELLSMKLSDIL